MHPDACRMAPRTPDGGCRGVVTGAVAQTDPSATRGLDGRPTVKPAGALPVPTPGHRSTAIAHPRWPGRGSRPRLSSKTPRRLRGPLRAANQGCSWLF